MKKRHNYEIRIVEKKTRGGDIFYTLEKLNKNDWLFGSWREIDLRDLRWMPIGQSYFSSLSKARECKKKIEEMYEQWNMEDSRSEIVKRRVVE